MNVLSLFDGMSCCQIALNRLGMKYENYFASEIDKHGIKVAMSNYPDTVQLGDVTKIKAEHLPKIDLLAGGSPCQGFSMAGKMLNFNDERSRLFFEFVRLKNELKPKYFLLENVLMKQEWQDVISRELGVKPIMINSNLVSAQNRKRLYWTNIGMVQGGLFGDMESVIRQPEDRGIFLKDILEEHVDEKYYLSENMLRYFAERAGNFNNGNVNIRDTEGKASTITASSKSVDISDNFIKINTDLKPSRDQSKAGCLTGGGHSGGLHSDMTLIMGCDFRYDDGLRIRKNGKFPTLQANAHTGISGKPMIIAMRGRNINGNAILSPKRTEEGKKFRGCIEKGRLKVKRKTVQQLEPRTDGKTNTITGVQKDNLLFIQKGHGYNDGFEKEVEKSPSPTPSSFQHNNHIQLQYGSIRRLTPVECERLQTVPDNYSACVSDTQRYKMLGNGFTVDAICHILSYMER